MTTPIGIDLSLRSTGYSGFGRIGSINCDINGLDRIEYISTFVLELGKQAPTRPVFIIEGYSFASRNSQAHAIGELGGVVRYRLWRAGFTFCEVPPTCRAKFATGRGNASKSEVVSSVSARTGLTFMGKGADDACDAWILEEMALEKLGSPRVQWPTANKTALETIDWANLLLDSPITLEKETNK